MSNPRRRAEIKRLREDGAEAFRNGESRNRMLIGMGMHDRYHWNAGWDQAQAEDQQMADEAVASTDMLTVAEHAFRAGWKQCTEAVFSPDTSPAMVVDDAWADYAKLVTVTI